MNTVFDPANLFITALEWQNSAKRDVFIQHLLDNLSHIIDYEITRIYWTDALEELLWAAPQLPPWRQNREWNLPLTQILYRKLSVATEHIVIPDNFIPCLAQPELDCSEMGNSTSLAFLELMHFLITKNEKVYLTLGANRSRANYLFSCSCHSCKISPCIIEKPIEWLHCISAEAYWPRTIDETDKLELLLEVALKLLGNTAKYEYQFSNAFLKDLIKTQAHHKRIVDSVAKRLTLTRIEASKDPHLQDEFLTQMSQYRFRVTQRPSSTRIHYVHVKDGLRFLRFYGEGEHDDGL
jgi:hypothetical protein